MHTNMYYLQKAYNRSLRMYAMCVCVCLCAFWVCGSFFSQYLTHIDPTIWFFFFFFGLWNIASICNFIHKNSCNETLHIILFLFSSTFVDRKCWKWSILYVFILSSCVLIFISATFSVRVYAKNSILFVKSNSCDWKCFKSIEQKCWECLFEFF